MRINLSPRVIGRSSRGAESMPQLSKLPKINERKSLIPLKKTESDTTNSNFPSRPSVKPINFFDIPSPIDPNKVAIVKSALENRKLTLSLSATEKYPEKDSLGSPTNYYKNAKSEIELQIEFLNEKRMASQREVKRTPEASPKVQYSADAILNIKPEKPRNSFLSIRKSSSTLIMPTRSTNKSIIDFTPTLTLNSVEEDQSELIFELRQEILGLKKVKQQLEGEILNQSQSFEQLNRRFIDEKKSIMVNLEASNNQLTLVEESLTNAKQEIARLRLERNTLKIQLDSYQANSADSVNVTEARIFVLKEELEDKEREYIAVKEQLKNSENNRKKFIEVSKDLEIALVAQQKTNLASEKALNDLKAKFEVLMSELRDEKEKTSSIDDINQELFQTKYENSLIKEENENLVLQKNIAIESLETVQKNFDNTRLEWREKENTYNNTIQDLLEQIQSERVKINVHAAETAKLRRALTLKDNDSVTSISKDEISRYQHKLMQMDKDYSEALFEIEKLRKTIDYYRGILKNKEEIIKKLESIENAQVSQRTDQNFLVDLQKLFMCSKCHKLEKTSILTPCFHLLCMDCKPSSRFCPICDIFYDSANEYTGSDQWKEVSNVLEPLFINKNSL